MAKQYRFGSGIKMLYFADRGQKREFMESVERPKMKSSYAITLCDKKLSDFSRTEKKRLSNRISYLSFYAGFLHSLKVKDYLSLNRKNMDCEKVRSVLEDFELEGLVSKKYYLLNEEERKRVYLAQIALSFYDILFIDDSLLEKYGTSFVDEIARLVSSDHLVFIFTDNKDQWEEWGYPMVDLKQEEYADLEIRKISETEECQKIRYGNLFGTIFDKVFPCYKLTIPLFVLSVLAAAILGAGLNGFSNVYLKLFEKNKDEEITLRVLFDANIEETKNRIEKHANTDLLPVINLDWLRGGNYNDYYRNRENTTEPVSTLWSGKFAFRTSGWTCLDDENDLNEHISLAAGSLPKQENEVMLTDYQLKFFMRFGMKGYNGQPSLSAEEITADISCVVGHEIQFVFDETEKRLLRISGILNTGFQEENYKHYFSNQKNDEYWEENLDYNYLTQYSYSNLCYMNRKIYSHLFELWDNFEYHEFWLIGKLPTSKNGLKYLAKLDYDSVSSKTLIANSYIDEVDTLINERWLTWFHLYVAGIFLTVLTCILSIVFFYHYFCYAGAGWKYLKYNKYSLCKTYSYPFALAGLLILASLLIAIPLGISILEIINCFSSKPYYAFGITGVLWALLASASIYLFSMIAAWILSDNKLISK